MSTETVDKTEKIVWEFVEVRKNPYDERPPTDPKALYSYYVRRVGDDGMEGSSFFYSEIFPLLSHFGIQKPEELVGKTFESTHWAFNMALNYLVIEIQHDFQYTPPSKEELYERAAVSLSNMTCPRFLNVDKNTVASAFGETFDFFHACPEWLDWFSRRIRELSEGEVDLVKANPDDFEARVRGPAEYLELVKGGYRQKLILGPYSTPISFEE